MVFYSKNIPLSNGSGFLEMHHVVFVPRSFKANTAGRNCKKINNFMMFSTGKLLS